MEQKDVLLKAEHISKSFGITKACKDISLEIKKGEIFGLIGENGSGKSTFSSMICGLYPQDSGTFYLNGKEYHAATQLEANKHGVSAIVQETGTLPGLSVAQNMFLGNEDNFSNHGKINVHKMNQEAIKILKEYNLSDIAASAMVEHYNFEKRKLIEIAKSTYFHPQLVIIDETTTALSEDGRKVLYAQMKKTKEYGGSVIFISHDLDEVLNLTDRIAILRDGEYIITVNSKEVNSDDLKTLMVGRKFDKNYYREDYGETISKKNVMSVESASTIGGLKNISFDLHEGEILGIGGLSDGGIHELGKLLFGAADRSEGKVLLSNGVDINSISMAVQNHVAYTSKDRDTESVVVNASIKDNICLMAYNQIKHGPIIAPVKEKAFANKYAKDLSVKMRDIYQHVSDLSGGNKQKVVLARWLAVNPSILILDSPTRGIDINVKADIYTQMDQLRKQGKSIVMISEELMELIGMCDRILIIKDGKLNGEFYRNKGLEEQDLIRKMV